MKIPLPSRHNYPRRDSGLSLAMVNITTFLCVLFQEFTSISNLEISGNYMQISEIWLY